MKKYPRIAIVGGGPGGLTLARILNKRSIAATVFERESSALHRPQGGSLDLHPDTGQYALGFAGLDREFAGIARYEDQETRLFDRSGKLLFEENEEEAAGGDRPEVDRAALRKILVESLPADALHWGHRLTSIEPRDDGTFGLKFENGNAAVFELVVGADGTRSRVRPLVSDAVPAYIGVTCVQLSLEDVDRFHPDVATLVGHGMLFALGDNRGLIAHRDANAHVTVYVALSVPEDWLSSVGLMKASPALAKSKLAAQFSGWAPSLLALIHQSGERVLGLPLYALPVGHRWQNRPGVTLLGDAAHVMSPWGGEGANLAMRDAADLATALVDHDDWRRGVEEFEAEMFARAEVAAAEAAEGIALTFGDHGLEHTLQHMKSRRAFVGGMPPEHR
jgi:2-polyprenyl-6-methoxyphenol hydroxylase-like FAD-dependent oxidoreductase